MWLSEHKWVRGEAGRRRWRPTACNEILTFILERWGAARGCHLILIGRKNCPRYEVHVEELSGPMPLLFSDGETEA